MEQREKTQSTKLEKDKIRGSFHDRGRKKKNGSAIVGSMSESDAMVQWEKLLGLCV